MKANLEKALSQWKEAVGQEYVRDDEAMLDRYSWCNIPKSVRASAILFPADVDEVQKVVRIAAVCEVPLYPISQGKNWGYGAACPVQEDNVILDLRRLNKIHEVNEKLAYAVVEPGVTQQQLYNYLKEHQIPLEFDVTGASPEASLLGNILERGYGQTPYSDHFLNSCSMEVVLADGRILETGFGHYPNAKTRYLYKWGIGPYLDGIFSQSNFGIVTKIGIWLLPKPPHFGVFFFDIPDDRWLGETVERLRELKLQGVLTSAVHLFNDIRVISSLQQYPWKETYGKTPLPEEVRKDIQRKHRVKAWNCAGGLRGTRKQIRANLDRIRKSLRGLVRVHYLSDTMIYWLERFEQPLKKISGLDVRRRVSFLNLLRGIPTENPQLACYWRKRKKAPEDHYTPLKDRCGLIWCSPMIPMTGEDVLAFLQMTRSICTQYGFETNVSMNLVTERALDCVVAISYDKEDPHETLKASECHREILKSYLEAGYIPYRIDTQSMNVILQDDPFWQVCREIKRTLDPHHIFSPGHYNFPP
ncbi:MAG: FAD-binding oxidoreductase [Candidatus Omnitrophica bacterium]|nr:FAD-binding oxidoreductase [Candidatus Omnitrophota bacterium]